VIGALIALLSLDVTRKLVEAGHIATTLTITGCTSGIPIVLTVAAPHGLVRPAHGVVSAVGGNVTADGVWVLVPSSATELSLYFYTQQGQYLPSIGSGQYTTGGVVQLAFPDGSILLGRRNVAMQTAVATPRIVFVPIGSPAWELDPYGGFIPPGAFPRQRANETPEQQYMKLNRQLTTERQRFEVHVTNAASPPDPDFGDFDATQELYQSLYGSMFDLISPDRAKVLGGSWASQTNDIQTLDTRGQKWVGTIEIAQPVTDNPLTFIPSSTDGSITVTLLS
jgi:hypothetical protein